MFQFSQNIPINKFRSKFSNLNHSIQIRNKCHYIQKYLQTRARARRLFIRANLIFKKEQDHNNGLDAFVSSRNRAIFARKNASRFSRRGSCACREDENTRGWDATMRAIDVGRRHKLQAIARTGIPRNRPKRVTSRSKHSFSRTNGASSFQ